MIYHLIINPASAGGKTGKREASIREASKQLEGDVLITRTRRRGETTELVRDTLETGSADAILVCGGDGTINEAVNGFFRNGESIVPQPLLGIIPSGSGGDFSRTFGISHSFDEAFARIARNELKVIDLAKVIPLVGQPRYFANISSAGLSAQIGLNTNKAKLLKRINGTLAYNMTILTTTMRHRRYPLYIKTSENPDGELWDSNCVAICNCQYFGGGIRVAREAKPGDGKLDVQVIHGLSPLSFLKGVSEIKKDDSVTLEGLEGMRVKWVEVTCNDPMREVPIEVDGEFAGKLPARFEIVPGAVQLF